MQSFNNKLENQNNKKIKINQAIIVEGKYDKLKLLSILDAVIITTDGFRIYKDKSKIKIIKKIAQEHGVIILTDSDVAGFKIRNFISGIVSTDKIIHVYIPQIKGKEKRKSLPSKENMIGVEGLDGETIINCLEKFAGLNNNVTNMQKKDYKMITKQDFYRDGLIGMKDSKTKREYLKKNLDLPSYLSSKSLLKILNNIITYQEYEQQIFKIKKIFN